MESETIAENEIYDYLIMTKDGINDSIGNSSESRRMLIKFKGWFSKQKFQILSYIESTAMGQRVLNIKDMRYMVISELDKVFNGMRTGSINRLDDDTLEDIMEDLADFFDCINLESFKSQDYEMTANLSSNLRSMLGMASPVTMQAPPPNSTWKPPSAPGLQNSDRILSGSNTTQKASVPPKQSVQTERSQQQQQSSSPPPRQQQQQPSSLPPQRQQQQQQQQQSLPPIRQQQLSQPPQQQQQQRPPVQRIQPQPPPMQTTKPSPARQTVPVKTPSLRDEMSESSYDEDEEDDISSFGGSDFDEEKFSNMAMSLSLRASLGLSTADVVKQAAQTDWKPPARPGMDNSNPIVAKPGNTVRK